MKLLSHDINIIIKRVFARQHPLLAEIIINWSKIVGAQFSSKATPLKIVKLKEKGQDINILYVQVENSSIALEISFKQQIILERIAVYLGFKAIHSLKTSVYTSQFK
ncbi:MAG: DUF721 domain-containing protein [Rickettsia endosymbiont of Bryobia graminum]|nr:DUF721 domain-containing protein [Rickettsia endosymbiont of Bryobia graminum]